MLLKARFFGVLVLGLLAQATLAQLSWLGGTATYNMGSQIPSVGAYMQPFSSVTVSTQTYPIAPGQRVVAVVTTNNWQTQTEIQFNFDANVGNNTKWYGIIGPYPQGTNVQFYLRATGSGNTVQFDNNGGQNFQYTWRYSPAARRGAILQWFATDYKTMLKIVGNLLRQRVDTTTQAWVRPRWFVALPVDQQPYGVQAAICTLPGSTSCPTVEQLAQSGVSVSQWDGGNMPSPEDLLYSWTDSRSGFTVLAFALVTAAFVWVAASVVTSAGAFSTAGGAGLGTSLSPLSAGAFAGGTYALTSTVLGGGGPVSSAQQGFLGATGSGYLEQPSASNPHAQALAAAISARHVHGAIGTNLRGTSELIKGQCSEGLTIAQCREASSEPGILPRPDSYVQTNNVLSTRERFAICAKSGLLGRDLYRCAAQSFR
jgi:hypothetical protein